MKYKRGNKEYKALQYTGNIQSVRNFLGRGAIVSQGFETPLAIYIKGNSRVIKCILNQWVVIDDKEVSIYNPISFNKIFKKAE